jgi:hypothetical protein
MAATDPQSPAADIGPFASRLGEVESQIDPIERASRVLEDTAFFDFPFYEFLLPTVTGFQGSLSERALATVDDFQAETGAAEAALMLEVLATVERSMLTVVRLVRRRAWDDDRVVYDLLDDFYRLRAVTVPDIVIAYQEEREVAIGPLFLEVLAELAASYVRDRIYQAYPHFYAFWAAWPPWFATEYDLWHEAVQPPQTPPLPPQSTEPPQDDDDGETTPPPGTNDPTFTHEGKQVAN